MRTGKRTRHRPLQRAPRLSTPSTPGFSFGGGARRREGGKGGGREGGKGEAEGSHHPPGLCTAAHQSGEAFCISLPPLPLSFLSSFLSAFNRPFVPLLFLFPPSLPHPPFTTNSPQAVGDAMSDLLFIEAVLRYVLLRHTPSLPPSLPHPSSSISNTHIHPALPPSLPPSLPPTPIARKGGTCPSGPRSSTQTCLPSNSSFR